MTDVNPVSQNNQNCVTRLFCSPMGKKAKVITSAVVPILVTLGATLITAAKAGSLTLAAIGLAGVSISPVGLLIMGAVAIGVALLLSLRLMCATDELPKSPQQIKFEKLQTICLNLSNRLAHYQKSLDSLNKHPVLFEAYSNGISATQADLKDLTKQLHQARDALSASQPKAQA